MKDSQDLDAGRPRALVVFMSGQPGSGKSVLASKLAHEIGLYHFERDTLKHGIEYTAGARGDRSKTIVPVYFAAMGRLADLGISMVADGALFKDKAAEQLAPIAKLADILIVHCQSRSAHERWLERERQTHGLELQSDQKYLEHMAWVDEMTAAPLDLPYPTLLVETDTPEYAPQLAEICDWINSHRQTACSAQIIVST